MSIAIGKLVVAGGIKEAEGAAIRRGANEGVALVEGAICHLSLNANTFAIENITTQVPPDTSLSLRGRKEKKKRGQKKRGQVCSWLILT